MYPDWIRETTLEVYRQGRSTVQVSALTGISRAIIGQWCKEAGISRSYSEAALMRPYREGMEGELNPMWKGDNAGYGAQHLRALKDFPSPLGQCQVCEALATCPHCREVDYERVNEAIVRARIDHTNLPYNKNLVLPMCHSCNQKHNGGFVILFNEVS